AMALAARLAAADPTAEPVAVSRRRGAAATDAAVVPAPGAASATLDDDATDDSLGEALAAPVRTPATERRRGIEILLGLWADVARDLALVEAGGARSVRDTVLLEELAAVSSAIQPGSPVAFLERVARAAELLDSNVSPELILDSVVLAWPHRAAAA
ncbi:MAG: hypothetical protein QOC97_1258, partial [Chloroflexota bacterium]|nr:hypothetical protein [Chloroflexota bacterium]